MASYMAYQSVANNLVVGDTNGVGDIFLYDTLLGTTTRVSVGPDGAQANNYSDHPALAADGQFVAFRSNASNLVSPDVAWEDVFRHSLAGALMSCWT